ncbi:MAG: hypothetical protein IJY87_04165 [Bacilli bacterium]|nr:hypothetical protein [Bacilli bacterium]
MKNKLLMILVCAISFLCITGCSLNGVSDSKKETNIDLNDARFYQIYKDLLPYTYDEIRENGHASFSDTELFEIAVKNLEESDISFDHITGFINYYTVSKQTILNYLEKYFGTNINFNPNRVTNKSYVANFNPRGDGNGMEVILYDESTDLLTVQFGGIGSEDSFKPEIKERKIISAVQKGDEIVVKEKAIYIELDYDFENSNVSIYVYDNPEKSKMLTSNNFSFDIANNYGYSVEEYLNDAYVITHTFRKGKNGSYYFAGSTYK